MYSYSVTLSLLDRARQVVLNYEPNKDNSERFMMLYYRFHKAAKYISLNDQDSLEDVCYFEVWDGHRVQEIVETFEGNYKFLYTDVGVKQAREALRDLCNLCEKLVEYCESFCWRLSTKDTKEKVA